MGVVAFVIHEEDSRAKHSSSQLRRIAPAFSFDLIALTSGKDK